MRYGQDFLGVGLGLRREHHEVVVSFRADIDFLEVLTENTLREFQGGIARFGGASREGVDRACAAFPVVLHGVSLDIGGPDPIDHTFVGAVNELGVELGARWFSDHLCWSAAHGIELHDLMPLPCTREAAAHVSRRVREVQRLSQLPFLLENPTTYIDLSGSSRELDDAAFLTAVLEASHCGLLLDVNNVFVNATNHGYDPRRFIDALPLDRVAQIHLAGHLETDDLLLDTHSRPVRNEVLDLYAHVIERTGPVSTLLEWDHDIPAIEVLVEELGRIRAVLERVTGTSRPDLGVGR